MTETKSPIDDDRMVEVEVPDEPPEGAPPRDGNDGGDDDKKKPRTPAEPGAAILDHRRFVETASGVFYEYVSGCGHRAERTMHTMLAIVHRAARRVNISYRNEVVNGIDPQRSFRTAAAKWAYNQN